MAGYGSLSKVLEESIRSACEGKHVGIAFSGGLDSGLVAAVASRYAESVTCYTCGTENAFDVKAGMELAEKFMGVSLASEKELVLIVTKTELKNPIMQAIMKDAGLQTKAKSIAFSLPVSDTAGLRLVED